MTLRVPAMMKIFTPAYATFSTMNNSVCGKPCWLIINRGQLVPVGLARGYVEKKEPEDYDGAKPIPDVEELAEKQSHLEKQRGENTEGQSMEKQEELKRRSDLKPEATDS